MKTYKLYSDPGHGWLSVKRKDLEELNILKEVSHCSYQKGKSVYLEEDSDLMKFIDAYKEKNGVAPVIKEADSNAAYIRNYERFVA